MILRPTVAEIDLQKLTRNMEKIHQQVGRTPTGGRVKVLSLLKANAYGHGAVEIGRFLEEKSLSDFFGVASVEEGVQLREAGLKTPILVLGSIFPFEAFEVAIENNLAVTVASLKAAQAVEEAAQKIGKKAFCHVKQDTGMGRIGTRRGGIVTVLDYVDKSPYLVLDGLYSHLSSVDSDPAYTEEQIGYFRDTLTQVKLRGIHVNHCHLAASTAIVKRPDVHYDMVRPGHSIYGLEEGYEPILTLKTRIVYMKDVPAGSSISYNRSFRADRPLKVATLPVGYGDGYLRALSNKAEVLIRGERCRVLGNITMDMMMVDVTGVAGAQVGDEVILAGSQGSQTITLAELAQKAGTIDYELCTLLMPRVPRIYK